MNAARNTALLLLAILLVGVTGGCMPDLTSGTNQPDRILVVSGPVGHDLNPYSPVVANRQVGSLVFRGLVDAAADGTLVPDLLTELPTAENGQMSEDGTRLDLTIVEDALWHDGRPVTADDVAYTLELLRQRVLLDEPARDYSLISSVSVTGPHSLTVELSAADSRLSWGMVPFVLPKHVLSVDDRPAMSRYWFAPIGCGPYRIADVAPATSVELEPMEADGAVPLRFVFPVTAEQAREAFDAASAAVWLDGPSQTDAADELVVSTDSLTWNTWVFSAGKGDVTRDSDVRAAVSSLLTHEPGYSPPSEDPFGSPHAERSVEETRAVTRRLEARGWSKDRKSGIYEQGRREMDLDVMLRTIQSEELPWLDELRATMQSAGIAFKTQVSENLDIGGYHERDELAVGRWHLARTRFYGGMPLGTGWPFYSKDVPSRDNPYGANVSGVADPELDALYRRLLKATDQDEARAAYRAMGERLNALGYVLWESPEPIHVLTKGVADVEAHPSWSHLVQTAPGWRLSPSESE